MHLKLQAVEGLVELLRIPLTQEGPQLLQLEEHQSLLHKVEVLLRHPQLQVVEGWQDLLRLQVEGAHQLRDQLDQQLILKASYQGSPLWKRL
jgi:hypothetical protein